MDLAVKAWNEAPRSKGEDKMTRVENYIFVTDDRDTHLALLSGEICLLPCDCEEMGCEGWGMVTNTPSSIKNHLYLYWRK